MLSLHRVLLRHPRTLTQRRVPTCYPSPLHSSRCFTTNVTSTGAIIFNGTNYYVAVELKNGGVSQQIPFLLDTGASYTQLNFEKAKELGLVSHHKLLGRSSIGDGRVKYDYLSRVTLSILGHDVPLVVKVAPNQPVLLGVDAMHAFGMDLLLSKLQFSSNRSPAPSVAFNHLDYNVLLHQNGITEEQLSSLDTLPLPAVSAQRMLADTGSAHSVLDLGTTFSFIHHRPSKPPSFVDLGFSVYARNTSMNNP